MSKLFLLYQQRLQHTSQKYVNTRRIRVGVKMKPVYGRDTADDCGNDGYDDDFIESNGDDNSVDDDYKSNSDAVVNWDTSKRAQWETSR